MREDDPGWARGRGVDGIRIPTSDHARELVDAFKRRRAGKVGTVKEDAPQAEVKASSNQEGLHLKPSAEGASCEVHDWPTAGMSKRLIEAMRERHGKGGVDVCRNCVVRAYEEAREVARTTGRKS